jgi:hypothetical protein
VATKVGRDPAVIRRTGPGEWTVIRPRIGFGAPERLTASSQAAAIVRLERIARGSFGSTIAELERNPPMDDALNPVSPWTPLWVPGAQPHVLPHAHT